MLDGSWPEVALHIDRWIHAVVAAETESSQVHASAVASHRGCAQTGGMAENPEQTTDGGLESAGDVDQLPQEDTLVDRGVDDVLDEGYTPPDRDPVAQMGGLDPVDPLEQRLDAEQPEVWDQPAGQAAGERQPDRAPRLEDVTEAGRDTDRRAGDAGIAGGAASAEEAAMRVEDENEPLEGVDIFTEPPPSER